MAQIYRRSESLVIWIGIESPEFLEIADQSHSEWHKGEQAGEEKTSWEQRLASIVNSGVAKNPLINRQPELFRLQQDESLGEKRLRRKGEAVRYRTNYVWPFANAILCVLHTAVDRPRNHLE